MKTLYQFIDREGEYVGLYESNKSETEVQRIVDEFYDMELDGELDDYLEERNIEKTYAIAISCE